MQLRQWIEHRKLQTRTGYAKHHIGGDGQEGHVPERPRLIAKLAPEIRPYSQHWQVETQDVGEHRQPEVLPGFSRQGQHGRTLQRHGHVTLSDHEHETDIEVGEQSADDRSPRGESHGLIRIIVHCNSGVIDRQGAAPRAASA
ncbi:hypothetical protein D3C76_934310 [compost metagenome]